jgi:O-antigen/teichoic acid export membrane protein
MLLASLAVPSVFGDVPLVLTVLASLTIPFSLHTQFIAGLQNLTGQVTLQFKAALVSGLAQLAALIALALLQLIDVSTALAVNLFGAAVAWVATLTRSSVRSWTVSWDAGLFKETMSHSLALHAGTILLFLHLRADSFMVKAISGTEALGIYSLGVVIAETVLLATDSVAIALLPRQVAADLADAAQVALRAARFNGYFAILFSLVLVGTGWFVIPLAFGQAFHETYPVLAALVPGILFMSMQRVCGVPVVRAGTPLRITAIFAVSLALNVALNLVWIPRFGPVGASLASSVSYAVAAALFLAWTAQLAGSLTYLLPVRSDADVLGRAVVLLRGGSAIRTGAEAALRERPR